MNKEEIFNEISSCFKMSVDMNGMKKIEEYITNLQQQNQKYKEVIDKAIDKLESLRDFIRNEGDYIVGASEIIVNITTIINILKEVE